MGEAVVALVLLQDGVAGGKGEGVGQVGRIGEVDFAGGFVGVVEGKDGGATGLTCRGGHGVAGGG